MIGKRYLISGRVQGVGFRFFAERCANELGVCGYVKNLEDGDVEVYAIADEITLEKFRQYLARGPRGAHVSNIEEADLPVNQRYRHFVIESGW